MKKVLFATTALIATAGVAAADVALSGDGRMGVIYDGSDFNFTSRARVTFTLSGETDGGLAFGGSFRGDHGGEQNGSSGSVYISGAFGKLTMGDINSGAESAVGDLPGVGLTGLGDHNEFVYPGSGGEAAGNPGLLYSYAGDNFNVYLSTYDAQATPIGLGPNGNAISIGGNYSFGNITVAAGYTTVDYDAIATPDGEVMAIAAVGTFGDVTVTAAYADGSDLQMAGATALPIHLAGNAVVQAVDVEQYGIGASTSFGATTVTAFYRKVDGVALNNPETFEADYIGLGASYDLGGGASLNGGIVKYDESLTSFGTTTSSDDIKADFGISFKF